MADALIFDVPVELGLERMAIVCPDFPNAERELLDYVIDEVNRIGSCVFVVDLERTHARCIVGGGILEAPDLFAMLSSAGKELDIHLDVMAGDLLAVALGMDFSHARSARQPTDAVAPEDVGHASIGELDTVIARQVPDDPDGPEVIFAA